MAFSEHGTGHSVALDNQGKHMDMEIFAEILPRPDSPLYHILCILYKLRGLFEVGMLPSTDISQLYCGLDSK